MSGRRYDESAIYSVVYFIEATQSKHIKIGTTTSMGSRLSTFQNGHCEPLRVIASFPGDKRHEAEIHDVFRESRIRGEWFEPSPAQREAYYARAQRDAALGRKDEGTK